MLVKVTSWLIFSLPSLSTQYKLYIFPLLMPHLYPLINILLTAGLINLLCISLEVHQLARPDRGALTALAMYLLPSAVFSALSNIPKFLLMETVEHEG